MAKWYAIRKQGQALSCAVAAFIRFMMNLIENEVSRKLLCRETTNQYCEAAFQGGNRHI
jgi:hypothetical protein